MRALEITIWAIAVLVAPTLFVNLGLFAAQYGTCDATVCQTQQFLYTMANQSSWQPLDVTNSSPLSIGWDIITFSLTFLIFAFFWTIYILSLIILIAPALVIMFKISPAFASFINIFYWLLWIIAVIQYKRGGLSFDSLK